MGIEFWNNLPKIQAREQAIRKRVADVARCNAAEKRLGRPAAFMMQHGTAFPPAMLAVFIPRRFRSRSWQRGTTHTGINGAAAFLRLKFDHDFAEMPS
jgi:hypothetical protein